jgi:hypothetical protein
MEDKQISNVSIHQRCAGEFSSKGTGAGDRDRTGDVQLGKLAFYH